MPDRLRKSQAETPHRDKLCQSCGRAFGWRKEQARDWDILKYCSDACRANRPGAMPPREEGAALEAAILRLLGKQETRGGPGKTICPSEAAKLVGGAARGEAKKINLGDWQPLMEPARAAARRLVAAGRIVITQHGEVVDPATAKGPIRLRLR